MDSDITGSTAAARDLRVPVRYYLRLLDVMDEHRRAVEELLRHEGIVPQLAIESDATLRFSQVEKLIEHLVRVTGRLDLGFELGQLLSVSSHTFVGFGMLSSATVDEALAFVSRYFRLVMPSFQLRYRSTAEGAELHFAPVVAMSHHCLAFHLEAMATAAMRDIRELSGGRPLPCRLRFSIGRPPHYRRYQQKQVRAEFGSEHVPGVRLHYDSDFRGIPLTMADPNARVMAEERCRSMLARVASVRQVAEWVAMTLREVSEGLPTLQELAGVLNISPRTLNRHLEREGTTFLALSRRIQHDLARERLSQPTLSITEVGYSLGFSDPANFTRSFRDREGLSPREFRKQLGLESA